MILIAIGIAVGIVIAPQRGVRDGKMNSSQRPELAQTQEPKSAVDPGQSPAPPILDSSLETESPIPAPKIGATHERIPKPVRAHVTKPDVIEPEELGPTPPPRNFVPVKRTITVTETVAVRPPGPVTTQRQKDLLHSPPGPFAKAPAAVQPLVLAAEHAAQEASLDPSATNFDVAAEEWERVIPALAGTAQQTLARQRVADARLQAWKADPSASRSATAIAALRRFIVFAPDGPAREAARAELARMLH